MAGQTDLIISTILDWIDAGKLCPGDVIDENDLADVFSVSRTPLREAFLKLEAMSLVTRLPRKGAQVFKPNLQEFLAILEVHAKLEGLAAGLAARRLSDAGRVALEEAVLDCEDHAARHGDGDPDRYYLLNMRFHAEVALAAGNPLLLDMIKTHARKLIAYYRARYRHAGAIADSAREHRHIFDLIVSRDSEKAEAAMQRHVQFDQVTAMDLIAALG